MRPRAFGIMRARGISARILRRWCGAAPSSGTAAFLIRRVSLAALSVLIILISLITAPGPAKAVELWSSEGGERHYSLDASLKSTWLLSHAPGDTVLNPERWSSATLWRMRLVLRGRPAPWLSGEVAYEQRARTVSESSGAGAGAALLPSEVDAPYRLSQLDRTLVEVGGTFSYRHELDRASLAAYLGRTEIVVGRQAIGWGRGLLFGAVDIFAPFTPLESDREWRRGIDAVRGSILLTDLISLDAVAALGESLDASCVAARLRGYIGNIDGELIAGRRYEDYLYAATASAPVWEAEVHGEAALFDLPEPLPQGGLLGNDELVAKLVLGGSYVFDVGNGLWVFAEYHYSGFGLRDIEQAGSLLEEGTVRERFVRGDTQILGRHAGALQATYGLGALASPGMTFIFSPADGSGVLIPALSWLFSDNLTLAATLYLPYGRKPESGVLRSEYGGTPASGLVQMSFYY
jgi:hypothetical protein